MSFCECDCALFKGCSHGTVTTVVYLSQLVDCMEFSVVVEITRSERLHIIPYNPCVVMKVSHSQSHYVNNPLFGDCFIVQTL